MNVVGRVGSLITQGVYSVATPFHPFGGAVDIIVVQQQDGTFRSTPWYVQFGKFQGVLKGAEKIVRINVNGVEANFHMYLDNSGEAYFIREGDSGQGSENDRVSTDEKEAAFGHSLSIDNSQCNINNDNVENYRIQSTLSDPGVLRDEYSTFRADQLDRTDSDVCRFYDFQDDQSLEGELSPEYGSSRFENLETVENFVEAQGSDSEMVLVSVDGHILTAPILSSEQNTEDLQRDTPQFHLGPGKGNGFCEEDAEFTVTESAWNSEYISDLDASSIKLVSAVESREDNSIVVEKCKVDDHAYQIQIRDNIDVSKLQDSMGSNDTHTLESTEGCDECGFKSLKEDRNHDRKGEEHTIDVHEAYGVADMHNSEHLEQENARGDHDCCDVDDVSPGAKSDKYRSCLDLTLSGIGETSEGNDPTLKVKELSILSVEENSLGNIESLNHREIEHAPELSPSDVGVGTSIDIGIIPENKTDNDSSPSALEQDQTEAGDNTETESNRSEGLSPRISNSTEQEHTKGEDFTQTEQSGSEIEVLNQHIRNSSEQEQANLNPPLEISLCGHLLRPGMGLDAANEAFDSNRISEEEFRSTAVSIVKNENLVIRYKGKYFLWDHAAHIVLGITAFGLDLSIESKNAIQVEQEVTPKPEENDPGSASGRRWRLWPIAFRRVKTIQSSASSSTDDVFVDSESISQNPSLQLTPTSLSGTPRSTPSSKSPLKRIVRTNIPTNLQIESLNLKEGQNDVTFSFSTRVLGLQQVQAHIYLWKWNARIVISDVDGTITKSDVLGQFMPLVGKDWSQSGVARLFSAIKENGYQLLFLSARAIVQAYLTKSFLFNLKQDGKTLPNGPVVISPNGLFPSLFREVIRRAPHEFKIACLEDIKALFPPDYNPFYAGFGNRDTDELTYRKLGIPKGKIFIINPKGEVAINHQIDVKSYTSLHTLVNDMFPPTSLVEQEDYNSWNYWKMPLVDIDV